MRFLLASLGMRPQRRRTTRMTTTTTTTTATSAAIHTTTQIHTGPGIAPLLRLVAACGPDRATPAKQWPRPCLPVPTGGGPAWPPQPGPPQPAARVRACGAGRAALAPARGSRPIQESSTGLGVGVGTLRRRSPLRTERTRLATAHHIGKAAAIAAVGLLTVQLLDLLAVPARPGQPPPPSGDPGPQATPDHDDGDGHAQPAQPPPPTSTPRPPATRRPRPEPNTSESSSSGPPSG